MISRHLPAITLLFLFACGARGAWEDAGVPAPPASAPAPRSTKPTRAAPARRAVSKPRVQQPAPPSPQPVAATATGSARGLVPPDLYSPFLDAPVEPLRWFSLMYVPGAGTDRNAEEVSLVELDSRYNLAQWRNLLLGDLNVNLRFKSLLFLDDAELVIMPTGLIELPLQFDWTWRYLNGLSFQIGARPGLYADAEALGDGLGVPFHTAFYYAVNPQFSWLLGAEVRPGWSLPLMPLVGLGWEPAEAFRLILALPSSTAVLQLGPIGLFGAAGWRNTSYGMSGEEGDPDLLTVEDIQLGGGLQIAFGANFNLRLEGGLLVNRSLVAENDTAEDTLDIDNSPYFRAVFGGSF